MNIVVYCGASQGNHEVYKESAIRVGHWIARNHHQLVYGGGKIGLMGILADTVLENGGKVIGVMPKFLQEREIAHPNLSELYVVESMSTRKQKMLALGDACVALPGGPGTLEEITEAISWGRIGENDSPCILYNENNFYGPLENFYNQMVACEFLTKEDREKILFSDSLDEIAEFIKFYVPPVTRKYEK